MITDAQRQAIRRHAAIIEEYESEVAREEVRLSEPYKDRREELLAILRRYDPRPLDADAPGGVIASVVFYPLEVTRELNEIRFKIESGAAIFAAPRRPDVVPWDTPRKIVGLITDRLSLIDLVYRRSGNKDRYEGKALDLYREARARALAFCRLAPPLVDRFPESDPILGLQTIRGFFEGLISE